MKIHYINKIGKRWEKKQRWNDFTKAVHQTNFKSSLNLGFLISQYKTDSEIPALAEQVM